MNLSKYQKFSINKNFYETKKIVFINTSKNDKNKICKNVTKDISENKIKINKSKNLFWAFYYLVNEIVFNKNEFKMKNDFIYKFLENIKKEKIFLKQNKIKISSLENMLYEKDISLEALRGLTLYFKKNLLYIENNKYYLFKSNDDDDFSYIEKNKENIIYEKIILNEDFKSKIEKKILMEGTRTCLKSISSYKLKELQDIALILTIDFSNIKKTKQNLYEEITMKIE
jgi:hypothetical protein